MDVNNNREHVNLNQIMFEKYKLFNEKYFGNRCPKKIILKMKKLLRVFGKAIISEPNSHGVYQRYEIQMNSVYEYEPEKFDAIFLHEMIHIFLYSQGNLKHKHGSEFISEAERVEKESGIFIPKKSETLLDKRVRKFFAIKEMYILQDPEKPNDFALVSSAHFNSFYKEYVQKMANHLVVRRGKTNLYKKYPKSNRSALKFYRFFHEDVETVKKFEEYLFESVSSVA